MKATKLIAVLGIATFAAATLGSTVASAAQTASSNGKVNFVDNGEGGIIDPPTIEPPEIVDPPEPPPVVEENGAKLVYYPDFNFGRHGVTLNAAKYAAILTPEDQMETVNGTKKYVTPFIQIQNTSEVKTWNIQTKLGQFTADNAPNGATKILAGAKVRLSNLQTFNNMGAVTPTPGVAATLPTGTNAATGFELTAGAATATPIFQYTKGTSTYAGVSVNSLQFGSNGDTLTNTVPAGTEASLVATAGPDNKYDEDTDLVYVDGATLELPAGSGMEAGLNYVAKLEWTLTATK